VEFSRVAEDVGFDRVGVSDTAPKIYHACYPAITACLLQTGRIAVGPYVSNPVTRHWSVHGATARAFEEIAPRRFFLGMATGDGAVHSVGLDPCPLSRFEEYIKNLRTVMPERTGIHMAFSGPKGMEVAGRLAEEVTIGTGLDAGALRELARRARAARGGACVAAPLGIWASAAVYFAEAESQVAALRRDVSGLASHGARFAFDYSFDGKNVPEDYQPIIRSGLRRYDFAYHGKFGDNPNGHLFDDHPELKKWLIDRFALIGTPLQCAARLKALIRDAELNGVWLMPAPREPGPAGILKSLELAADAFGCLAASPSRSSNPG
jgi:alkanesulfonate monooxygenase SsuD/methylene tetrahydromethanopterin reductase-like flavin-dependent oxidoreductase (luciferase family)